MDKTPVEVAMFLKENGVPGDICDVFEGNFGAHSPVIVWRRVRCGSAYRSMI